MINSLLPQLIESTIDPVTVGKGHSDSNSFRTERLANPPLPSMWLLTARGVVKLLQGEITEAKSDLREAINQGGANGETVTAYAITQV